MELGLPLLAGVRFAEELTAEVSARHTQVASTNKFNGVEQVAHGKTFAVKMSYRPVSRLAPKSNKRYIF